MYLPTLEAASSSCCGWWPALVQVSQCPGWAVGGGRGIMGQGGRRMGQGFGPLSGVAGRSVGDFGCSGAADVLYPSHDFATFS